MEMKPFGKIKVNEKEYLVVETVEYNEKNYVCCTIMEEKIPQPIVFEYKYDEKLKIREEKDEKTIKMVLKIMYEKTKK